MAYETIIYEKKGRIAYVTLNRPETLNAFNNTMHNELYDVWQKVMKDDDVWVVVLTGAGRAFCSGADMKEATQASETGEARRTGHFGFPSWTEEMNKPIVCAINGICAGAGLILLGDCDIVICSEDTQFLDPHVSVGWVPFFETMATARRMPFGLAMRIALMGTTERMSAQRAYQVGLVSEVVPHYKLMERATEIAQTIAEQAPLAVRTIKELMNKVLGAPYTEGIEMGLQATRKVDRESEDAKEGPRAFAQKRKPEWKGK